MSGAVTDSIFTFVFRANSGDRWGGTLVADHTAFTLGVALTTGFGRYEIVSAQAMGVDLSAIGLEEGTIFVDWYFDSRTAAFLVTRNGPSVAAGFGGLGSEFDAAWNGTAWDSFGSGGADQAEVAAPQLSRFTWRFVADTGDTMEGALIAASADYAAGDTVRGARGTYHIQTETVAGDPNTVDAAGVVTLTAYWDAASRIRLTLENGGASPSGIEGLGSERDRAWTGAAWVEVGLGGQNLADHRADSVYTWTFSASGGDRYSGWLYAAGVAMQPGDTWATPDGSYRITGETASPSLGAPAGRVWVTEYFDAASGRVLPTWYFGQLGTSTTDRGLGQEVDAAWDDDGWDLFGRGGALQASVEMFSMYTWRFEANSGDRWGGSLWADSLRHQAGDVLATSQGRYVIQTETLRAPIAGMADGTVWIGNYTDAASGQTLSTWYWGQLGQHASTGGLGNEVDAAWTGYNWQQFGRGGALQVEVKAFSMYTWRFEANSGDRWGGSLWADGLRHQPGDVISTAQGRYVIQTETPRTAIPSLADGTVWIGNYHDSRSGQTLSTWWWGQLGQSASTGGLGAEIDAVWTGNDWQQFGRGGALQADVKTFSMYTWRFEANSGDRWGGSLWADSLRHQPGDMISTMQGRYLILTETPRTASPSLADGTVWIGNYMDAASGQTLSTWYWGQLGQHASTGGLGNEVDAAWTGYNWQQFGRGGALQVEVKAFSMYTWRFEANSGDRWGGSLWADSLRHQPGDVISTAQGRYVIQNETPRTANPSLADGTVWIGNYYDSRSDQTYSTWYWGQLGQHASTGGLGAEIDAAWTGVDWQQFGRGGALQVDGRLLYSPPELLIG